MRRRTKRKLEKIILICMIIIAFAHAFIMSIYFSDQAKKLGNETELTENETKEQTPQLTISPIEAPKVKATAPKQIPQKQEPTQKPTPKVTKQPQIPTPPDIENPLDDDMKSFIYNKCRYDDDMYCFVMAVIKQESNFNLYAVSADGLDWGPMQLRIYYHKAWAKQFGVADPKNPYDNITIGTGLLWQFLEKYEHKNLALMCYNCGEPESNGMWKRGIYSTGYTRIVLAYYEEYLKEME